MPNRIVRDGILFSVSVSKLTPRAELLYRKLLSVVDDYGRFYAEPVDIIIASCFPLQVSQVSAEEVTLWLRELKTNNLISVYSSVEGKSTLEIKKFDQRRRASKSKFPANPKDCHTDDGQVAVNGQPFDGRRSPEYEYEDEVEDESDKGKVSGSKDKKAKGAHFLPQDWEPTESHAKTASEEGVNLVKAAKLFRNWADGAGGKPQRRTNWNLTFTNALMNVQWMGRQAPAKGNVRAADGGQLERIKIK